MARKQTQETPVEPYVRPALEIIQQFLADMQAHPDVQLANCEINGPCPQNLMLKGTPRHMQHLSSLRIVHRDPMETQEEKSNKPWKWQGVVDEINAKTQPAAYEKPNPKWEHLLAPKVPTPELQEATP